jgi:hypothetical protein
MLGNVIEYELGMKQELKLTFFSLQFSLFALSGGWKAECSIN